ncbi:Dynamitin-domain-containing protein [Pestalotiopsis sp. NC0098]|nr:Dynamitin-domain-containing protein [Pestalotiopsis sp. NC0098]
MALNRKYSQLPDLDTAPDIYETPDLTDDNSTAPTTLGPSQSEYDFDDEENDGTPGISRSKLRIDEARNRFLPAQVDARDVNFSDRLDGKRKSYKSTSRRQRILENGTLELGDLSGDEEDDAENLERKIARLRREIEEAKDEYNRQKASADAAPQNEDLTSLSTALDEMTIPASGLRKAKSPAPTTESKESHEASAAVDGATYTVTYAPDYEQSHTLAKTADFDRRLVQLETAIGVTAASMPGFDGDGLPRAVVPTLDHLQKQLTVLSEASTASLDSVSRRVRELTKEAEQLEKSRKAAKAAQESLEASGVQTSEPADEQTAKINALYGTLPTIENLTPLLPPLLDRLRSLKAIHSNAATASETLERIEQNQSEMAADIIQWREGLDKIEGAMKASDSSMNANMEVIDGWVKELEARISKLS